MRKVSAGWACCPFSNQKVELTMSPAAEKPLKIGSEITVRISLTFQEAPDVHTLLAMTPVRERGKLVRLALERYIKETAHPAGDVERQIIAISAWLRSRELGDGIRIGTAQPSMPRLAQDAPLPSPSETIQPSMTVASDSKSISTGASPSINRWLQT